MLQYLRAVLIYRHVTSHFRNLRNRIWPSGIIEFIKILRIFRNKARNKTSPFLKLTLYIMYLFHLKINKTNIVCDY